MTSTTLIRDSLLDAAAVLLPVRCSGCGSPDRAVCADCARAMRPRQIAPDAFDPPLLAALDYDGVARRILLAFKDGGRTDAAPVLAGALRAAIVAALPLRRPDAPPGHLRPDAPPAHLRPDGPLAHLRPDAPPGLVPVVIPSTRAAFRRRGYHPTAMLLRRSRILSPPLWRALRLTRQTRDQVGLTAGQRAGNREGSLVASPRLRGRDCLIVDDIVTTGSTVREAARAVAAAGGRVVAAVAVARTPLRGGAPRLS